MRVLLVYAHPDETSFDGALRRHVREALAEAGHALTELDLYADAFAPALSLEEWQRYRDPARNEAGIDRYVAQLRAAEAVVFVYPTWWYGMPAILKGYFDRVWIPGVAFDLAPDGRVTTERLRHIRKLAVVTTCGAPWWLIRLYLGDPARRVMAGGVRPLCARDCRLRWLALYDMDGAGEGVRAAFVRRVRAAMRRF